MCTKCLPEPRLLPCRPNTSIPISLTSVPRCPRSSALSYSKRHTWEAVCHPGPAVWSADKYSPPSLCNIQGWALGGEQRPLWYFSENTLKSQMSPIRTVGMVSSFSFLVGVISYFQKSMNHNNPKTALAFNIKYPRPYFRHSLDLPLGSFHWQMNTQDLHLTSVSPVSTQRGLKIYQVQWCLMISIIAWGLAGGPAILITNMSAAVSCVLFPQNNIADDNIDKRFQMFFYSKSVPDHPLWAVTPGDSWDPVVSSGGTASLPSKSLQTLWGTVYINNIVQRSDTAGVSLVDGKSCIVLQLLFFFFHLLMHRA